MPKFQMRGVCSGSQVDVYYRLKIDGKVIDNSQLLGFKHTKLVRADSQMQWNIVSLVEKRVLAFSNSSEDFPFGTRRWFFTDDSCTDPGQVWRTMNLQQFSEQPGQFCCDDGICIHSEHRYVIFNNSDLIIIIWKSVFDRLSIYLY